MAGIEQPSVCVKRRAVPELVEVELVKAPSWATVDLEEGM
jgi:hypothetical protein